MLLNQSWKSKLVVLFKKSEFLKNLVKIKKKKKIVAMRIFMILIQISVIDLLLNIMKTLLFYQNIKNQKELHNRKKNKKRQMLRKDQKEKGNVFLEGKCHLNQKKIMNVNQFELPLKVSLSYLILLLNFRFKQLNKLLVTKEKKNASMKLQFNRLEQTKQEKVAGILTNQIKT